MSFYDEMQGVATELMAEFKQGTVIYNHPGADTGTEWDPQPGSPTPYPLDATVRGVQSKYLQEGYIAASDLQVTTSAFGIEPVQAGTISIDGRNHEIIEIMKLPGAGTVAAWRFIVKS